MGNVLYLNRRLLTVPKTVFHSTNVMYMIRLKGDILYNTFRDKKKKQELLIQKSTVLNQIN